MKKLTPRSSVLTLLLVGASLAAQGLPSNAVTPTVTQLLDASNAEYIVGGVPQGLKPFKVDGAQLKLMDTVTGAIAATWVTPQNQVVIAYQGTSGGEFFITNPAALFTQVLADAEVTLGLVDVTAPALTSSLNFAHKVLVAAKEQGYASTNVFVTGHSLGGIEAEYVALRTGLAGIGFEPSGLGMISAMSNEHGKGANFVNVVTWGDPVGNTSSDIPGDLLGYRNGGGGLSPHYGNVVVVGDQRDQASLNVATIFPNLIKYHLPGVQAHDLGITLNPYAAAIDGVGDLTGTIWNVGNDTIPQLLADAKNTGRYYAY